MKMKSNILLFVAILTIYQSSISTLVQSNVINKHETSLINERIIGGIAAYPSQYPYMAAITIQTSTGAFFCVGVLISNEWVLTAAHCVDGANTFTIQLGSTTLQGTDPNRQTLATSTWVVHPAYNSDTLENDIGLIKFRLPIQFTDYISSIDQLSTGTIGDFQNVRAIGWGQLSDSDTELSNNLHWVSLSAIPNSECELMYGPQVTENTICVVGSYNEGPCWGDSGGPLVYSVGTQSILVAVSSFLSTNGCETTEPAGYTRIDPYVAWIQQTTNS